MNENKCSVPGAYLHVRNTCSSLVGTTWIKRVQPKPFHSFQVSRCHWHWCDWWWISLDEQNRDRYVWPLQLSGSRTAESALACSLLSQDKNKIRWASCSNQWAEKMPCNRLLLAVVPQFFWNVVCWKLPENTVVFVPGLCWGFESPEGCVALQSGAW